MSVNEEEVIEFMSNLIPLECWFVMGDLVYNWNPVDLYFSSCIIEDDDLFLACEVYLRKRGRVFSTLQEVSEVALREGWPNARIMH